MVCLTLQFRFNFFLFVVDIESTKNKINMSKLEMINKEQCVFSNFFLKGIIVTTHTQLRNINSHDLK